MRILWYNLRRNAIPLHGVHARRRMSDLLAPETTIHGTHAEYRIISLIGRGGMGAVYRALRLADSTIWALKEMRPAEDLPPGELEENRRLFLQEAELLGKLSHPGLPVVADLFEYQGRPVMIMEFVPGQTLEHRIRDANAPLLEQQVIGYGIQIARILHYLHTRTPPIIYRDLKPSNVMLTPEGVLKLIDFGVARTYKARKAKDTIAMGSAGYAPPEQYGKGQTDARSDVYALGATLLHLLTNLPPIPLQTPAKGSIRKLNPSVDARTEEVIIKAMNLEPSRRFSSALEFEQALHRCLDAPYVDPVARATPPPPIIPPVVSIPSPETILQAPSIPVAPVAPPASPAPPTDVPASGTACARCGRINKPNARFCAGCGAPLSAALTVPRLIVVSPRSPSSRRSNARRSASVAATRAQHHYPELDLAEHDRGIASRHHAMIDRNGDHYTLVDLGSTNGTLVNGSPLPPHQKHHLRSGDRIKIGEVEIEFRWG
jgi:serine/threonine protein kinase